MNNRQASSLKETILREEKARKKWLAQNPQYVRPGDFSQGEHPMHTTSSTAHKEPEPTGPLMYTYNGAFPPMPEEYAPAPQMTSAALRHLANGSRPVSRGGRPQSRGANGSRAGSRPASRANSRPASRSGSRLGGAVSPALSKPKPIGVPDEPEEAPEPEWQRDESGKEIKPHWWYKQQLEKCKNNLDIPDEVALYFNIAPTRSKEYCDNYFGTSKIAGFLPGRVDHAWIQRNRLDGLGDDERESLQKQLGLATD